MNSRRWSSFLALVVGATVAAGASACADEEACESQDAGPPDAGEPECPEDGADARRGADEALEPTHVIGHIGELFQ